MKFEKGDIVRIADTLDEDDYGGGPGFDEDMLKYCSKVCVVLEDERDDCVKIDVGDDFWHYLTKDLTLITKKENTMQKKAKKKYTTVAVENRIEISRTFSISDLFNHEICGGWKDDIIMHFGEMYGWNNEIDEDDVYEFLENKSLNAQKEAIEFLIENDFAEDVDTPDIEWSVDEDEEEVCMYISSEKLGLGNEPYLKIDKETGRVYLYPIYSSEKMRNGLESAGLTVPIDKYKHPLTTQL